MKRVLLYQNLFLLLGAFTVFFMVVFFSLVKYHQNNQHVLMTSVLAEVESSYLHFTGTEQAFVSTYQTANQRRITLLDSKGFVMADSHDSEIGQDKSNRPEIIQLEKVFSRNSDTVNMNLLYIAKQMPDGNYLRVSLLVDSQLKIYSNLTWTFILSSLFWVSIYYVGVLKINQTLLKPWYQVKDKIQDIKRGTYQMVALMSPYPEINEIMHEINQIHYDTAQHISKIKSYQAQLDKVLNEIKQGVLLINHKGDVTYFNDDAKVEFQLTEEALFKPMHYSLRNVEIKNAILRSLETRENQIFDLRHEDKWLEIRVFYISVNPSFQQNTTILTLIKDVTTERKVDQMKRDFFAHASHELKSPLTAIKGHAELISHEILKGKDVMDSAHRIVLQAEMMTALVEDMLILSRLEHLTHENYTEQPIDQAVLQAIDQLQTLSKSKHMILETTLEPISFACDEVDIIKMVKNIIENAIRYSPSGSKVYIELKNHEKTFTFKVKDEGIGISKEHQHKVFERFYRVDKGRLDGGTGLGLAIVKHVVIKYRGTIELLSKPKMGTTIIIEIPK